MTEKPVRDYDKFMLRFPDGMRDIIAERAKSNGRSMNSEIVQILQDAIDGDKLPTSDLSYEQFFKVLITTKYYKNFLDKIEKSFEEYVIPQIESKIEDKINTYPIKINEKIVFVEKNKNKKPTK
ncbi:TPA: Arc family DNA-binding protein [Salmonella enterica]|nr:Arc family DNA-binding protein [Salmonella enterica subsp. enterica serovar Poona]HAK3331985.1 Arc family DNA-binding protein [Salmonella enterica]